MACVWDSGIAGPQQVTLIIIIIMRLLTVGIGYSV